MILVTLNKFCAVAPDSSLDKQAAATLQLHWRVCATELGTKLATLTQHGQAAVEALLEGLRGLAQI